eukprot:30916-Pelagococcus_subviridis.AAC.12
MENVPMPKRDAAKRGSGVREVNARLRKPRGVVIDHFLVVCARGPDSARRARLVCPNPDRDFTDAITA